MSRYRLAVSTIMVCREPGVPHPRRSINDPETAAAMGLL